MDKRKILIIRFSSFGDVVQSLSCVAKIKQKFPDHEIHFLTKHEFIDLIQHHPQVSKVLTVKGAQQNIISLILKLIREKYTKIYDAHSSFRSKFIVMCLQLAQFNFFTKRTFTSKPKHRWKRFLLFQFRINKFRQPFSGQRDLLEPLAVWDINEELPATPQIFCSETDLDFIRKINSQKNINHYITLAPSAAHALKRWPLDYWKKVIQSSPTQTFVTLGGPQDTFLKELEAFSNVVNLAGQLTFGQTIACIQSSKLLITNDTGALHVAEQLGKSCVALMGPAPFGFPSRKTTSILQLDLSCRPCSKHGQGPCVNSTFQKCLVDIKPEVVQNLILK